MGYGGTILIPRSPHGESYKQIALIFLEVILESNDRLLCPRFKKHFKDFFADRQ
jgi:hypothetical protein